MTLRQVRVRRNNPLLSPGSIDVNLSRAEVRADARKATATKTRSLAVETRTRKQKAEATKKAKEKIHEAQAEWRREYKERIKNAKPGTLPEDEKLRAFWETHRAKVPNMETFYRLVEQTKKLGFSHGFARDRLPKLLSTKYARPLAKSARASKSKHTAELLINRASPALSTREKSLVRKSPFPEMKIPKIISTTQDIIAASPKDAKVQVETAWIVFKLKTGSTWEDFSERVQRKRRKKK
jgi:hypothetical protein